MFTDCESCGCRNIVDRCPECRNRVMPDPNVSLAVNPRVNPLALSRWRELGRELAANPDIELDLETFAPLSATFTQLRRQGHPFDPTLAALMDNLKRQGFTNDGDGDWDPDTDFPLPRSERDRNEVLSTNAAKEDLKFSLHTKAGVA